MGKTKSFWFLVVLLTIVGALAGYLIAVGWALSRDYRIVLSTLLGGVIGFSCLPLFRWLISGHRELNIESADVKVPLVGVSLKIKLGDAHRMVGWKLFVEAATRVTTQRLEPEEGIIREALSSLYKLFDIARAELKSVAPSRIPVDPDASTVESYAIRMLNDGLRQMLSRWHPRLSKWEKTNLPESQWPLAEYCRADLETTRAILLAYTWGLGEMLKVPDLGSLLPKKPTGIKPALTPVADIQNREREFELKVSDAQRAAGWHILVELISRVATQPLDPQSGLLSEALTSLYELFETTRSELKQIPVTAPTVSTSQPDLETVESISLSLLNKSLRPFLAKWHPRLSTWEKLNPGKTESEWPEREDCRTELEATRKAILSDAKTLGKIIKLEGLNALLL